MQPHLDQLRKLLRDDPNMRLLFELLRRVRVRGNLTGIANLARTHDERRPTRATSDRLLRTFRLLESCGFGRVLDPTQRARARFEWVIHPITVADIAENPDASFQPHHLLTSRATLPPPAGTPAPIPAGSQRHSFSLRPDLEATLILPTDLTTAEARRLGHYLLSLVREG